MSSISSHIRKNPLGMTDKSSVRIFKRSTTSWVGSSRNSGFFSVIILTHNCWTHVFKIGDRKSIMAWSHTGRFCLVQTWVLSIILQSLIFDSTGRYAFTKCSRGIVWTKIYRIQAWTLWLATDFGSAWHDSDIQDANPHLLNDFPSNKNSFAGTRTVGNNVRMNVPSLQLFVVKTYSKKGYPKISNYCDEIEHWTQ